MHSPPSSAVAPDPRPSAEATGRDVVVAVGWRVENDSDGLRVVPYLVRGHPDRLPPDVRYAVPLTPAWCLP